MNKKLFENFGRMGGRIRARNLSPARRSEIAASAAQIRWKNAGAHQLLMPSVRFAAPSLYEPAYLEEVLLDGSLRDWRRIIEEISDHPFGPLASALERVLASNHHYGVTPLWSAILRRVQGQ
jgi:hypothetical protein